MSDKPWRKIIDPTVAKFNAAWLSNGTATWTGEGAKALAKLLTEMADHLDNGDDFFVPRDKAAKETETKDKQIRRTMSDHGRMLWKEDVEGICPSIELCFENEDSTVRCGPCAIKQATAAGVETQNTDHTYLPEVARLNRANAAKDQEIDRLNAIIQAIPDQIKKGIREVEDNNSYWGGPHRQKYQDAPEILKNIESLIKDSREKEGQNHHEHSTHSDDQSGTTSP